jgi:RNA 3'-terminal phosphate cyclase
LSDSAVSAVESLKQYNAVTSGINRTNASGLLETSTTLEHRPLASKGSTQINVGNIEVNVTTSKSIENVPDDVGKNIVESIKRAGITIL